MPRPPADRNTPLIPKSRAQSATSLRVSSTDFFFCYPAQRPLQQFQRAVEAVMVRRLKEDVRVVAGGFPIRRVVQVDISGLPSEAPELRLAELLDNYGQQRRQRFISATKREQTQGALILSTLQQRLFLSVEAFHRTLSAQRRAMERVWAGEIHARSSAWACDLAQLTSGFDKRSQLPADQQESEAEAAVEQATAAVASLSATADTARERQLLDEMGCIATQHRFRADGRVTWLIEWLQRQACPDIRLPGATPSPPTGAAWSPLRLYFSPNTKTLPAISAPS